LRRLEEAKKRDHRVLGKQLDLFSIQEEVGPGLILWHPKGAMLNFQLRRFIEDVILERGYQLVYTPNVTREELFLRSGHLPLYAENQFPAIAARGLGKPFGLSYRLDLATRPAKKLGTDETWDLAERALEQALKHRGATYRIDQGGGAFYGPKIDIKFNDVIGREWQGATIQLDFEQPERFKLEYTGEDNRPHRPVMIHRVLYGPLERFVDSRLEHCAGRVPIRL